jgi:Uma2 family endonuclease
MASAPLKTPSPPPFKAEPAWEIAKLFPLQGPWDESDYLKLSGTHNYLIEYSHGNVEVLPMPTQAHQRIVAMLYALLLAHITPKKLGEALFAPLPVRLGTGGKYREPDVVFMLQEHRDRQSNEFWSGADLVMEVVSDDYRKHDLETKRFEYARAGIPEYWIIDPMLREVIVLKLAGDRYEPVGTFKPGEHATSVLLPGFTVDAGEVFAAAERQ